MTSHATDHAADCITSLAATPVAQARDAVGRFAGRECLVEPGPQGRCSWTFAAAWAAAESLATGFLDLGLGPGDRLALWMANRAEFLLASWAAEMAGLVRVPLNARYTDREVAGIVADCQPALAVVDPQHAGDLPGGLRRLVVEHRDWEALAATPPAPGRLYRSAPGDLCSLNYTSGSTGSPKGVMLSHRHWAAVYRNLHRDRDIRGDDRLVHIGPLSHASGAYVLPFLLRGAANVIAPHGGGLEGLLQTIAMERGTVFTAVPTLLTRLADFPRLGDYDLSSLRQIGYGGEPIPPATLAAVLVRFGPILVQNYGLTEAMMTVCHLPATEHLRDGKPRTGTIGRPYTGVEVVIREPDGTPVPPGQVGELTVRADHVMAGYWGRPEETAAVLRDGWLWSGDLARHAGDGLLELAGRSKDMLICGGFNIYPAAVEAGLAGAPGLAEVAVVGIPDRDWGEVPVAFVTGEHLNEERLRAWARPRLGLQTPRHWVICSALPHNATGKVDRRRLRDRAVELLLPQDVPPEEPAAGS